MNITATSSTERKTESARAIVYCRVSTADQKDVGTSLDTQREACLQKASELGAIVPEEAIIMEDQSGKDLDRPGLRRVLNLARTGAYLFFISFNLDRLYRPETEGEAWQIFPLLQQFQATGLEVLFVLGNTKPGNPVSAVMTFMEAWRAGQEREAIRERTMRGKRRIAHLGRLPQPMGRFSPYGTFWSVAEKRLIWISEVHRLVIRRIIDCCLAGESIRSIVLKLNADGVPATAGGIWRRSSTHRVLKHAKLYAGTATWSGIDIPGALEGPICTLEEAMNIDRKLTRNKERAKGFGRRRWLSGRVFGHCGHRYSLSERGARCQGADKSLPQSHRCKDKPIGLKTLESKVFQVIQSLLEQPERLRVAIIDELVHQDFEAQRVVEQREMLTSQIMTLEKRRNQLSTQHEAGVISDAELSTRFSKLKEQRRQTEEAFQDLSVSFAIPKALTAWLDSATQELWVRQMLDLAMMKLLLAKKDPRANSELDQLAEEINLRVTVQDQSALTIQFRIPNHLKLPTDEEGQHESTVSIVSQPS